MVEIADIPCLQGMARVDGLTAYLELVLVPSGAMIVREGERDNDMFFVLEGRARVVRGGLDVGHVRTGGQFGELALLADKPHETTLIAETEMQLAKLSRARFDAMCVADPPLALAFTRSVVGVVGSWLSEMTQHVAVLLRERSLPRRTHAEVRVGGQVESVRVGTPLMELLPEEVNGELVVAALLDWRPVSLVTRVASDAAVAPLTTGHWEGRRIYRESVGLLLLEAAHRLFPELEVSLQHSIGLGQRVAVRGANCPEPLELAVDLETEMRRLVVEDQGLREEWWTVDEARAHFLRMGWRGAAELLDTSREATVPLVSYGEVYARHRPLAPRTGLLTGFRVRPDEDGVLLVFGSRDTSVKPQSRLSTLPPGPRLTLVAEEISRHTRGMMSEHLRWLDAIGTLNVGALNRTCITGDVSQLVRVSEGFQEKQIGQIADEIVERAEQVKVVCIAGPSSSGKSTFIKRLRVQLLVNARMPVVMSLDDYYVNRTTTPRDADGELDYEAFAALNHELLQQHLRALLEGQTVATARYDFFTGESFPSGGPELTLGATDLLMLEGIHGLNPRLLATLPDEKVFRVFICPLSQLPFDRFTRVHASDVRLVRRLVRDRHTRGATAENTILRWPSVRRGERLHIFPFQQNADAVFDTSLIYELSVLKVYAERYLLEVPKHSLAYPTAFRLLRVLDQFVALYPDHVPPTSIVREFIGGSGFEY